MWNGGCGGLGERIAWPASGEDTDAVTAVGPGLISGPGTSIPQVKPHSQKQKN